MRFKKRKALGSVIGTELLFTMNRGFAVYVTSIQWSFGVFLPFIQDIQIIRTSGCRQGLRKFPASAPPAHGGAGRCCTLEKPITELEAEGQVGQGRETPGNSWLCLETRDLQVVTGLVLGFCCGEVVFKETLQIFESWTLLWVFFPAVDHKLVQGDGTVLGTRHPITTFYLLQDFTVIHACKEQPNPHCYITGKWTGV